MFERSLNRVLEQTPGASSLLAQHAGKCVRLDLGFTQLDFSINDAGRFVATSDTTPDASLRATSALLLQLPFLGREALRHAEYSGDAGLLQTLDRVFRELRWDIEAELAPLIGDIAAHRVANAAQRAGQTVRHAVHAIQTSSSEYIVEEIGVLARKSDVARFCAEVDALVNDVARLEARLARLETATSPNPNVAPQS